MRIVSVRAAIVAALFGLLALPAAAQQACVGDCGNDGVVSVDELVRGVGIALGIRAVADCPAFDRDNNSQVTVNELVQAVTSALNGCISVTATPTSTPTTDLPTATPTRTARPNFIVINLDDTRFDGVDRMPVLQERLAGEGVSFTESFVPNSVCCPSRASILTGLYAIHHGTRAVGGPLGGADTFRESGADQQTIAVWLREAGYTTGLFGKYLNDYGNSEADKGPGGTFYIPPGWDRWRAQSGVEAYGGVNGNTYRIVDETRTVTEYADHSSDAQYSTDLIGGWVREFIADAAAGDDPFFAYWAPNASHGDPAGPAPATRHLGLFSALEALRLPNWNEPDISDKPRWVASLPPDPQLGFTDEVRRRAYESLLSVDEMLESILADLEELGIDDHTVVLLTSDNGVNWGEHRQFAQYKESAYEESIRVPLLARFPRGVQGPLAVDAPVLNIDVPVTLAALAGATVPPVDGQSFAAYLTGAEPPAPRPDFLLEHTRAIRGAGLRYGGQMQDGDQVRMFFDLPTTRPRPSRLFEFDTNASVGIGAIQVPIGPTADISLLNLALTVIVNVPNTTYTQNTATGVLNIFEGSPDFRGVLWQIDRDQGNALDLLAPVVPPDYFGVRDVARGYTYVEYESEEVELYDLEVDPWQLENKARDPAYAATRTELAARLRTLLEDAQ